MDIQPSCGIIVSKENPSSHMSILLLPRYFPISLLLHSQSFHELFLFDKLSNKKIIPCPDLDKQRLYWKELLQEEEDDWKREKAPDPTPTPRFKSISKVRPKRAFSL